MIPRLRQVSGRLQRQPLPDQIRAFCTCSQSSPKRSQVSVQAQTSRKGKEVIRSSQTRAFRSSTAFCVRPQPSTSDDYSWSSATVTESSSVSPATLEDVKVALEARDRIRLFSLLNHFDDESLQCWPKETLDAVYAGFADTSAKGWVNTRPSRTWHIVKRLRKAYNHQGVALTPPQVRWAFQAGVRWEKLRQKRQATGENGDWNTLDRETARRDHLEVLRADFQALPRDLADSEGDAGLLEDYTLTLLAWEGREALAFEIITDALSMLPSHLSPIEAPVYVRSVAASAILPYLFRTDSDAARTHLQLMLVKGRLPRLSDLQKVLREQRPRPDPDEAYAHARSVLDAACGSTCGPGRAELDQLLQDRLAALRFEEAVETRPYLAFLEWLGKTGETTPDPEGVELALRLWEAAYADPEEISTVPRVVIKTLDALVMKICSTNASAPPSMFTPSRSESPVRQYSINLALQYLPVPLMVDRAHHFLNSSRFTVDRLRTVYGRIKTLAPPESEKPFQWHTNMLPAFTALTLSSVATEPSLVIQLYHEWTATGMAYPQGLWTSLWRSTGIHGDPDELKRVIGDYEATGRGRVNARIASFVVEASAGTSEHVKTLRLLTYFRRRTLDARSASPFRSVQLGSPTVSLDAYHAVLRQLAFAIEDRRHDVMQVFSWLLKDGYAPTVETFNALLAAQVFRPMFQLEDVDNAGTTYNALVRSQCAPDAVTFSLLMYGFLRMAERRRRLGATKSLLGLDAALRTFNKASDAALIVRGQQVAKLMRVLASRQRWEEAKSVAERWWTGIVQQEKQREGEGEKVKRNWRAEMQEVELASEDVLRSETRWLKHQRRPQEKHAGREDWEEPEQDEEDITGERFNLMEDASQESRP